MSGYLAALYLRLSKALKISRKYEYFGMEIEISPGVFDPFLMVSGKVLADSLNFSGKKVIEIGTGSGIISLKLAKLGNEVVATEISKEAARCAKRNARKNGIELEVVLTSFAHGICGTFDVLVSNFPYFKGPKSFSPEVFSDESFVKELLREAERLRVKEIYLAVSSKSPFLDLISPYSVISEVKVPFEKIFAIKKEISLEGDREIMEFPPEVLTVSKKGKVEVRKLIDRGEFVRYEYLDPKTGKRSENKIKIVLRNSEGKVEEYFVIPLKQHGRYLMLRAENKGPRMLWDGKKAVPLFEDMPGDSKLF